MLTNSNLRLSNSEPLDKLWPVLSLVTHPDKPWFQVLSFTLQQTLTNSESCHMPPSHPWVSQIFLDHGTHQVLTLNPWHNPQWTSAEPHWTSVKLWTKLWHWTLSSHNLFPNIVIIPHYLISSDPVLTVPVHIALILCSCIPIISIGYAPLFFLPSHLHYPWLLAVFLF